MEIHPFQQADRPLAEVLLGCVALFKQVHQVDPQQFELLLSHSQVLEAKIGEVIIETGQVDSWLYCLLKGQLVVYAGEGWMRRVNSITPGEVFGDVAVLMDHPRSATVIADVRFKRSTLLRTDFSIFGEVADLEKVSLPVKLIFYRNMVHNLRWKLESYRSQFPELEFAADHRKIRLFSGTSGSLDELLSLDSQARQLAALLTQWNLALVEDLA